MDEKKLGLEEMVSAFFDSELPAAEAREILARIESGELREEVRALSSLQAELDSYRASFPEGDVRAAWQKFDAQLETSSWLEPFFAFFQFVRTPAFAAGFAVCAALVVGLTMLGGEQKVAQVPVSEGRQSGVVFVNNRFVLEQLQRDDVEIEWMRSEKPFRIIESRRDKQLPVVWVGLD